MALPAASGNRSSSTPSPARSGCRATKSSANVPPAVPARPMTAMAATAQALIVAHGLRAMGAVEEAGRQALDELRHLLGVLRPRPTWTASAPSRAWPTSPARRVDPQGRPRRLAGRQWGGSRAPGPGGPVRLPDRPGGAHQRAQARRSRARTEVRLGTDRRGIVIEVLDDGRGATVLPDRTPTTPGREVTASSGCGSRGPAGRTLDAGPRPGGGFSVVAHLPTGGAGVSIRVAVVDDQGAGPGLRHGPANSRRHRGRGRGRDRAGSDRGGPPAPTDDVVLMDTRMPEAWITWRLPPASWPRPTGASGCRSHLDPDEYVYKALRADEAASCSGHPPRPAGHRRPHRRRRRSAAGPVDHLVPHRAVHRRMTVDAAVAGRLERLTDREREVVVAVACGSSNAEIARRALHRSDREVARVEHPDQAACATAPQSRCSPTSGWSSAGTRDIGHDLYSGLGAHGTPTPVVPGTGGAVDVDAARCRRRTARSWCGRRTQPCFSSGCSGRGRHGPVAALGLTARSVVGRVGTPATFGMAVWLVTYERPG